MASRWLLPVSLLALLFASPLLAAPFTPNNPFHHIAAKIPKQADPLVCCLRPLEPLQPTTEEAVLLSFEDWKAKQARERAPAGPPITGNGHRPGNVETVHETAHADSALPPSQQGAAAAAPNDVQQEVADSSLPDEHLLPHFRIPITDRFNYASTDCSARVHTAHRSAKSAYSILTSKKDKYMLSPCAEQKQFVIVELCEDIRIDTVQLANYEFFSGVFKDFSVTVAKTYTTDPEGWTAAGTYRAQNVRGVQSFHPPPSLRDFYRFIRIDFHSHYGNEYYCPVSLLRVYGLTHLEEWKWNSWEEESKARRPVEESAEILAETIQATHAPTAEPIIDSPIAVGNDYTSSIGNNVRSQNSSIALASPVQDHVVDTKSLGQERFVDTDVGAHDAAIEVLMSSDAASHTILITSNASPVPDSSASTKSHEDYSRIQDLSADSPLDDSTASTYHDHTGVSHISSVQISHSPNSSILIDHHASSMTDSTISLSVHPIRSPSLHALNPTTIVPSIPVVQPLPPVATGGESIYRTIMNRLMTLEANTTLYARYVEEQTAGMREVLRRLGEDIGRLEGIGKAQAQMYQRSVQDFERHRRRLEVEHNKLLSKVDHLTDEVVLEKRLGIAQLCLLLAVLVFMTLTRGSRGEHFHGIPGLSQSTSMRDWGRRTLSFSGDWVNRFRSRSPTPQPAARSVDRAVNKRADRYEFAFPTQAGPSTEGPAHGRFLYPSSSGKKTSTHPRTPSGLRISTARHHNLHGRPVAHGSALASPSSTGRPPIQRTSSGGLPGAFAGVGPVPKSAKRWARSSHLHEVKSASAVPGVGGMSRTDSAATLRQGADASPSDRRAADSDIFGPPRFPGTAPAVAGRDKGKAKLQASEDRRTVSPLRFSSTDGLSGAHTQPSRPLASESEVSEGDGWVDTDAEASGSETGLIRATAVSVG
ncbi:UNC-like C-terminal-domain-containing protein [Amylocystis lapponica]|nr:UNC-like C-terminal-domain-containing protein [Amylocystis lapponica]